MTSSMPCNLAIFLAASSFELGTEIEDFLIKPLERKR